MILSSSMLHVEHCQYHFFLGLLWIMIGKILFSRKEIMGTQIFLDSRMMLKVVVLIGLLSRSNEPVQFLQDIICCLLVYGCSYVPLLRDTLLVLRMSVVCTMYVFC